MRVLFLTTGDECEPSSRWRVYQWLPRFEAAGIRCTVRPLAGRRYLELGYGLRQPSASARTARVASQFASRVARRTRDLATSGRFDLVVVQKESFPLGLERIFDWTRVPLVFDLDDAVYARHALPDGRGRGLARAADAVMRRDRALPALLRRCARVVVGNETLAGWAREHAAPDAVRVIPTVVDARAYGRIPVRPAPDPLAFGWVGTPRNAVYLEPLVPVFQSLATRHRFRVELFGPEAFEMPGVDLRCHGWRHYAPGTDDELADLTPIDVGLMPLPDTDFARGKCAFKLIQTMAAGRPVVASPVGANASVVGDAGLLASTPDEWETALERMLEDAPLRARLGARGRERVAERYSIDAQLPDWLAVLGEARRTRGRRAPARTAEGRVVEPSGIEPPTSALRTRRSPN